MCKRRSISIMSATFLWMASCLLSVLPSNAAAWPPLGPNGPKVGKRLIPVAEKHGTVRAKITLPRTREPGRGTPPCGNPNAQTTADAAVTALGSAIDTALSSYTGGLPIVSGTFKAFPAVTGWIKSRLGANNGPSACGTVCVSYPSASAGNWFVDASDGHGSGRLTTIGREFPIGWSRLDSVTYKRTAGGNSVTCAAVRQWKHDRDRTFVLTVNY